MAWIWFSCFCCASENFRLMPASFAALFTESVLAERQPDSEPTCEKPRVIVLAPPPLGLLLGLSFLPQAASTPAATTAAPPPTSSDLLLTIVVSSELSGGVPARRVAGQGGAAVLETRCQPVIGLVPADLL